MVARVSLRGWLSVLVRCSILVAWVFCMVGLLGHYLVVAGRFGQLLGH